VADHTKWNQRRNYKGLTLESIDTFITNQVMSNDLYNTLKENGVEIAIASED
jgi:DeoR/GlpR family transcriptional regulator of sugar metabolism